MKKIYSLLCIAFLAFSTTIIAQPAIGMTTFFTNTTTALVPNTSCILTKTVTLSGWLFSVSSTSNCGFNWTNSTGGDGRLQYLVGFGTLTQATFGSDDGSEHDLQSLTWGVSTSSWTSKPMQFVGYKNGMPVPGATLNVTTPSGTGILNTLVVNFNSPFDDVDEVRLSPVGTATCNSILFFEDITIGPPIPACVTPTLNLTGQKNVLCNGGSTGSATVSASGGAPFTYTWSPSGGNATIATGLSAGMYTCVVTNSCGSTASQTVLITEPTALASSTAMTSPLCNGANGSATITLSGGTAPYTYTWSSGPTSSVEPTLLAGTYTVRGTDASGCSVTRSVTITQPSAISTATAFTMPLCNGGTGSATVAASGGVGAYTYSWSSGATTSVVASVLAGTYTVKVTDGNNCTNTKSVTITQPTALVTSTAITNVLCFGNSTGAATVTASGGAGGYTYSWSSLQTTSVVTGLNAGVKTVTVTDANGCTKTNTVTISQPVSAVSTSTAITNVLCFGNSTGSATVTASGGAGGYTYSWSSLQTTSVVTGLNAGVKTVTVTDANGCTKTNTVTISQPASAVSTSTAITNVLCFGNSTGAATVTASGGTGGYTYSWSSLQTTSVVTGLNAGVKTVTVTDANNCTVTNTITISQPVSAVSTSTAITNVLCFGNSTGSATVTATGGTGGYSYSWSTAATSSVITGLNAGVKTVTVTDANNCTTINSVSIGQPSALNANATTSSILCNGGVSTVTISATGGTPTYSGVGTFTMLAGSNTFTISDANSCSATTSVSITQPAVLNANATASSILCNGGVSTITVSATGGTPTYSGVGTFTALAGSNTFTISDANSCSATTSVSITQPAVLNANATASSILCNGGVSTVTVSATGGTPTYSGVGTFTMLAGSNTFTISDANSCSTTASVSVSQPAAIVSSQTVNICSGKTYSIGVNTYSTSGIYTDVLTSSVNGCDSTVTTNLIVGSAINISTSLSGFVITANNTLATSYQWMDCNNSNLPIPGETNQTYTATANGNYAVIVTEGPCSDTSACVSITGSGIVNFGNTSSVHIYPNPSTGLVSISSSEVIKTVIVTDMLGKQILLTTVDSHSAQLDLSNEKSGVYIIRLIGNTQTLKRVIISK